MKQSNQIQEKKKKTKTRQLNVINTDVKHQSFFLLLNKLIICTRSNSTPSFFLSKTDVYRCFKFLDIYIYTWKRNIIQFAEYKAWIQLKENELKYTHINDHHHHYSSNGCCCCCCHNNNSNNNNIYGMIGVNCFNHFHTFLIVWLQMARINLTNSDSEKKR